MIIVLDCNIWITLAINRQVDFPAILQKKKTLIAACPELYTEVTNVLLRPKFKRYFTKFDIEQLIQVYELTTTEYTIEEIELVVSDQKDNYLFALCKSQRPII